MRRHKNLHIIKTHFSLIVILIISLVFTGNAFALTASNCVNTTVGNSTGNSCPSQGGNGGATGNAIADYGIQLAAAIKKNCPRIDSPVIGDAQVYQPKQYCIDPIINELPNPISDVIALLHDSVNGLPANQCAFNSSIGCLQCVGFVQGVAIGIGTPLPPGNAGQFSQDQPGYKWYQVGTAQIQAGDYPVWTTHIAVATGVLQNGWFNVVEANGGNGSVGDDSYPQSDAYGLHYLGFLRKI